MSGIALKFTSLLVRTLAKPIANALKAQAKDHEIFRRGCIAVAQSVHSTDLRLRMSLLGEKKIKIRPLNDTKAIDNGANFLSEFFIFSVAGSLIFYESYRSRKKATDERESIADDITLLQSEIEYLKSKLKEINVKFDDYKVPQGFHPKYIKLVDESKEKDEKKEAKEEVKKDVVANDVVAKEEVKDEVDSKNTKVIAETNAIRPSSNAADTSNEAETTIEADSSTA